MLLELIAVLGLKILFTETPNIDCNVPHYDNVRVNGCYYKSRNEIYLSFYAEDMGRTLHHEIGHAIFMGDPYSRIIIKDYKPLKKYNTKVYHTEKEILNEMVADYYVLFVRENAQFSIDYPCLWFYFNSKLKTLTK